MEKWDRNYFREEITTAPKPEMSVSQDAILLNKQTGEQDDYQITTKKRLDYEPFVKIFKPLMRILPDLKKPSQDLLRYIMLNIARDSDRISIHAASIIKDKVIGSKRNVYVAINELQEKEIIHSSSIPNVYFINPKMLFIGDRSKAGSKMRTGNEQTIADWNLWLDKTLKTKEITAFAKGVQSGIEKKVKEDENRKNEVDWNKETDSLQELGNLFKS